MLATETRNFNFLTPLLHPRTRNDTSGEQIAEVDMGEDTNNGVVGLETY
jgi:hypothetical protein